MGSINSIRPDISVIIPTIGRPTLLSQALQSIVYQDFSPEMYEVIVVDNGDNEQTFLVTQKIAAMSDLSVRYFRESRRGLHHARHTGAQHARGTFLLYGDDDIVASENWVERIYDCYQDASVGCVGGKIVARWRDSIPSWVSAVGDSRNCGVLSLLDLGDGNFDVPTGRTVFGCNFSIRADILRDVGGFNPDGFPAHLSNFRGDGESGLQAKVRSAGYRILYSSRAVVEHVIPDNRLALSYAKNRLHLQGISRGFTKSRAVSGNRAILLADFCGLVFGAVLYYLISRVPTNNSVTWSLRSSYLFSRARHEFSIATNRNLRDYTLRDSFWDE